MVPRMARQPRLNDNPRRSVWRASLRRGGFCRVVAVVSVLAVGGVLPVGTTDAKAQVSKNEARLKVEAIPAEAVVYVDGVPTAADLAERGLALAPGAHRIELAFDDGRVQAVVVDLQPGVEKRVKVDALRDANAAPAAQPFPIWPAATASAAAGGFALATVVYGVIFLRSLADYNAAVREASIRDVEGASAPFAIVPLALERKRRALLADGVTTAIFLPAAAIATVVAGGLWGAHLVSSGALATE